jgi:hypothetical protein
MESDLVALADEFCAVKSSTTTEFAVLSLMNYDVLTECNVLITTSGRRLFADWKLELHGKWKFVLVCKAFFEMKSSTGYWQMLLN